MSPLTDTLRLTLIERFTDISYAVGGHRCEQYRRLDRFLVSFVLSARLGNFEDC